MILFHITRKYTQIIHIIIINLFRQDGASFLIRIEGAHLEGAALTVSVFFQQKKKSQKQKNVYLIHFSTLGDLKMPGNQVTVSNSSVFVLQGHRVNDSESSSSKAAPMED